MSGNEYRIPLGDWIENFVDFLLSYFQPFTNALSTVIEKGFAVFTKGSGFVPPFILLLVVFLAFWKNADFLFNYFSANKKKKNKNKMHSYISLAIGLFPIAILFVLWNIGANDDQSFWNMFIAKYESYIILIFTTFAAWRLANYKIAILTLLGLALVINFGLWAFTLETVALILVATTISILIGLPLGILGSMYSIINSILTPILDFMQTMPAFVYLIPAIIFFGIGNVPGVIATVIFAIPPVIRLTTLGIRQVPKNLIEAADAFGSTKLQKLFKVQLPIAKLTIMAGINQTIMLSLSMVVIAGLIGSDGLGNLILKHMAHIEVGASFEGGLAIVIIAIIFDRITQHLGKNKA